MYKINEYIPTNIANSYAEFLYPTIVSWNRLEGTPRTHNFDKAIRAEVRDALWMLTKQWQMGELNGEDAGSPIEAKVQVQSCEMESYSSGNNAAVSVSSSVPLEVLVEHQAIPMQRQQIKMSLDIRLNMGYYWSKLLRSQQLSGHYAAFLDKFSFQLPIRSRMTDYIYAHKEELQQWKAVEGRCIDGYELYLRLRKDAVVLFQEMGVSATDAGKLDDLGKVFIAWFKKTYFQAEDEPNNAWLPDRLEYKFACEATEKDKNIRLTTAEYYQGHLDWYAFNLETGNARKNKPVTITADSFVPTSIDVDGMPDKRWWKFEDGKTNLSKIKPGTTDIAKLMMIEFGLTYANDWFLIPYDLPIGGIAEVQNLVVKNNFGDVYWLRSAETPGASNPEWSVFRQKAAVGNNRVFLCPSALYVQEGECFEKVNLLRDEVANMVWAVEHTVPATFGRGVNGAEYALQKRAYHNAIIQNHTVAVPYVADIYYAAMTEVPENWIPFLPVHLTGHSRQIQLQRSSMLRILDGDPDIPRKIKPQTSILRDGLDVPQPKAFYLHEDEVPRSGTFVRKGYGRTRWTNGEVYVWVSTMKQNGSGEGSSGLAFDEALLAKK